MDCEQAGQVREELEARLRTMSNSQRELEKLIYTEASVAAAMEIQRAHETARTKELQAELSRCQLQLEQATQQMEQQISITDQERNQRALVENQLRMALRRIERLTKKGRKA